MFIFIRTFKKTISLAQSFFIFLFIGIGFGACSGDGINNKETDATIGSQEEDNLKINILRYEKALFSIDKANVKAELIRLRPAYCVFLDGDLNNELNIINIKNFISDKRLTSIYAKTTEVYPDLTILETQLSEGFSNFHQVYPKHKIPKIYTYVSDLYFEQPVVDGDTVIIIALDMFLGKDFELYPMVGLAAYQTERCIPERIAPEVFEEIAKVKIKSDNSNMTLLNKIIRQGKLLYFVDCMLPDINDAHIIGYTEEQLKWCRDNEAEIWNFIMSQKLLYQTDPAIVSKLYNDGPFTAMLPKESPGKLGVWVGWQIVKSFMDKNNDISLDSLMHITDAQQLFMKAKYRPDK